MDSLGYTGPGERLHCDVADGETPRQWRSIANSDIDSTRPRTEAP
jgi:hypothetical protein